MQLLDEHPTRPASRAEDQGGKALETMARVRALVVDKTGTLTAGRAKVVAVHAAPGFTADEVIRIAAPLDQASKHIVAETIVSEARRRGHRIVLADGCRRDGRRGDLRPGGWADWCRSVASGLSPCRGCAAR